MVGLSLGVGIGFRVGIGLEIGEGLGSDGVVQWDPVVNCPRGEDQRCVKLTLFNDLPLRTRRELSP